MHYSILFLMIHLVFANSPTHLQPRALHCTSFPNKRGECHISDNFGPLTALHKDIQQLIIIGGNFLLLQDKPFSNLKSLQQLTLIENKLETLTNTAFEGLSVLTKIEVRGHISQIEEDTFKPCPLLQELNLHGNKITHLKPVAITLIHLEHLQLLKLSENPIESIKKEDLEMLSNSSLASIDLSNCNITTVDQNAFTYLKNLTIFNLPLNSMSEGNLSNALENITKKLKYLTLTNSTLVDFPTTALEHISSFQVQKLTFCGHQFKAIKTNSFPHMPNLLRLVISCGPLECIDEEAFDKLPALVELYLNNNILSQFPQNMPELPHLTKLVLSHNHISLNKSVQYFSSMPNLVELNLSYNAITYNILEVEINLNKIDKLYLEHNSIVPWDKSILKSKLNELDLGNNKLDIVTLPMLDDFDKVHILELHNNPFNCTACEMSHFAKWLSSNEHLEMSVGLVCAIPEGTKVVKMLKAADCND